MIAVQFLVNEVFDIAARGGLVVVGTTRNGEFVGIPTQRYDDTGETILVVGRADADYVRPGRLWNQE
jgi:hypothetical protein